MFIFLIITKCDVWIDYRMKFISWCKQILLLNVKYLAVDFKLIFTRKGVVLKPQIVLLFLIIVFLHHTETEESFSIPDRLYL